MTAQQEIEDAHGRTEAVVKGHLGNAVVITIVSINDREGGQLVLSHPGLGERLVADRLRLCADILAKRAGPAVPMAAMKMRPEHTPEFLDRARVLVKEKPSTSYVQRKLGIGYNHACDLMELFEREGLISTAKADGSRVLLQTPWSRT